MPRKSPRPHPQSRSKHSSPYNPATAGSTKSPEKPPAYSLGDPAIDGYMSYGRNSIAMLLAHEPQRIRTLYVHEKQTKDGKLLPLLALAKTHRTPVELCDKYRLSQLAGEPLHQGIVADCAPKELLSLKALCDDIAAQKASPPLILALDQVSDPRNLGAIIRVAAAAGVAAILLPKHGSAAISGLVDRASAGTLCLMTLVEVTNLSDAIDRLKTTGVWWAGTNVAEEASDTPSSNGTETQKESQKPQKADSKKGDAPVQSYLDIDMTGAFGLVLGSEGDGIRPRVLQQCDFFITIPMAPAVESLNVSTAAAVLLFEAARQRQKALATSSQ